MPLSRLLMLLGGVLVAAALSVAALSLLGPQGFAIAALLASGAALAVGIRR